MNDLIQDADHRSFSVDDDFLLFVSLKGHELASNVLRIKHNDPEVTRLELSWDDDLSRRAWRRLGHILGETHNCGRIGAHVGDVDVAELHGLQINSIIKKIRFSGIDLQDAEMMRSFAPFLASNPHLKVIRLATCNLGLHGINILSNSLSNRSEDTLEGLDLSNTIASDIDLDSSVLH